MDSEDQQMRLRLMHLHFTLLTIQKAVSGSRLPEMDALKEWQEVEKAIRNGIFETPTARSVKSDSDVHHSLHSESDLRTKSDDELSQVLREFADARFGAIHEDPNDLNSPIVHWMPTDIRRANIMLIQREMDRRSQKKIQRWNWALSAIGIGVGIAAVTLSALSLFGFPSLC